MSSAGIWVVIAAMGVGTYLMRLSFLGLVGGRRLPGWLLRHLRHAPHAVLPAMIVPMLLPAGGAAPEPLRLAMVALTLAAGVLTRSTALAVGLGAGLWLALRALGALGA